MKRVTIGMCSVLCLGLLALPCQAGWGDPHPAYQQNVCHAAPAASCCPTTCCRPGLLGRLRHRIHHAKHCHTACCQPCPPCRPGLIGRIRQCIAEKRCCHQACPAPVYYPSAPVGHGVIHHGSGYQPVPQGQPVIRPGHTYQQAPQGNNAIWQNHTHQPAPQGHGISHHGNTYQPAPQGHSAPQQHQGTFYWK